MKVAWHEVPGDTLIYQDPSRRGRYELDRTVCSPLESKGPKRQTIIPYSTGRNPCSTLSRHFVPGYLHSVPPGHLSFVILSFSLQSALLV